MFYRLPWYGFTVMKLQIQFDALVPKQCLLIVFKNKNNSTTNLNGAKKCWRSFVVVYFNSDGRSAPEKRGKGS